MSRHVVPNEGEPCAEPAVSVVMPVHNALPHLDKAIESILGQTYGDFEFVILDDASTDGSSERLRYWARRDPRIRVISEDRNLGPAISSDRVARAASAPIVARMDADDVAYPDCLAQLLSVLHDRSDVGLVGALWDLIDSDDNLLRGPEVWRVFRKSISKPFGHSVMMYRRSVFDAVGGYRKESEFWEDLEIVLRMSRLTKIAVIPRPLSHVRVWMQSRRTSDDSTRREDAIDLMYRCTERARSNRDYENLLNGWGERPEKVDPRVFISIGSAELWGSRKLGGLARLFQRLLKRGRLGFDMATASAIVWTSWAAVSPSTLRIFLRGLLHFRNRGTPETLPTYVLWEPTPSVPVATPRPEPARRPQVAR